MTAMLSTGFEITPSPSLRTARSSLRKLGAKLFLMALATSALVVLAGVILLESASGIQLNDSAPGAQPEAVTALQGQPPVWAFRVEPLPPKLPREWVWKPPTIRFDGMFREAR